MNTEELSKMIETIQYDSSLAGVTKGFDYAVELVYSVMALTLKDELGFGHKRVERILKICEERFQCIDGGKASLEDYKQAVKDELNITITATK